MIYSKIKELFNSLDIDEVQLILENLGSDDFQNSNYRFIKESVAEAIASDLYVKKIVTYLVCFNADLIADNTNLSYDIIKALQEGEQFEAIGTHIMKNDNLMDMMSNYIQADGYGHVFSSHDGNYEEITIDDEFYIFFRV